MLSFQQLRMANTARNKEWDPNSQIDLAFREEELIGEVGEFFNVLKKLSRERMGLRGSRATEQDLANELADVLICVDLMAMHLNINLEEAVRHKFNQTSNKYALEVKL